MSEAEVLDEAQMLGPRSSRRPVRNRCQHRGSHAMDAKGGGSSWSIQRSSSSRLIASRAARRRLTRLPQAAASLAAEHDHRAREQVFAQYC